MSSVRVWAEVPLQGDLLGEPSPGSLIVESDGLYGDRVTLRAPNGKPMHVSVSALRRAIDAADMAKR